MSSPPISKRAGGGGDVELGSVHRPTYHDYEAPKEEKEEEEKTDERRQSTRTHPHRLELALVAEYSHVVQSDDRNKRSSVEYAKDATWQMSNVFAKMKTLVDFGEFHYPTASAAKYFWMSREVRNEKWKKWSQLTTDEKRFFKDVNQGKTQLGQLLNTAKVGPRQYAPEATMKSFVRAPTMVFHDAEEGKKNDSSNEENIDKVRVYDPVPIWSSRTGRFWLNDKNNRCGRFFDPFCEGNKSDFGRYGPGTAAWFKFLKWMGWTLVLMTIVNIPLLIFNSFNYDVCAIKAGNGPIDKYSDEELENMSCFEIGLFTTFLGHISQVMSRSNGDIAVLDISPYVNDAVDIGAVIFEGYAIEYNTTLSNTGTDDGLKVLFEHYIALDLLSTMILVFSFFWFTMSIYSVDAEDADRATVGSDLTHMMKRSRILSAQDYSVALHGLPANVAEKDIVDFAKRVLHTDREVIAVNPFCKSKKVYEIHNAVHIGSNRLSLFKQRGDLMNQFVLAHLNVAKIQSQRKHRVGNHSIWKLNCAIKKRNELLSALRFLDLHAMDKIKNDRGEDDVLFSVLTFNRIRDKEIFVKRLRKSWFDSCCGHPIKFTDDRDIHSVKKREFSVHTTSVHHPSQIIWENLHYNWFATCKRRHRYLSDSGGFREDLAFRRLFVLLVALVVIVLTFSLAVALNTIAKSTGNCPEFASNLVVSPETCGLCGFRGESLFRGNTSSVAYQTCYNEIRDDSSFSHVDPVSEVESHPCFWRDQGVSDQFEACEADYLMECYCSSNFYTLCCLEFWGDTETVLASIAKYFGVSTLISVVLVTASFIMRKFLSFIAKLEHPHSSTKMQISKAERILIFQIVNSGLTILFLPINNEAAITCDNGSCTFNDAWAKKLFSKEWYDQNGTLVLSTMLVYGLSSWLFYLPSRCLLARKRRKLLEPGATTSAIELNEQGMAEPFTLSDRIADNMTTVFLAVIFSSGFPITLPIAALSVLANFWVDKWLFLRYYSIQTEFSLGIFKHMAKYFPFLIIAHCVGALMMFGNYSIFFNSGERSKDTTNYPCTVDATNDETFCDYDSSYDFTDKKFVLLLPALCVLTFTIIFLGMRWFCKVLCKPCKSIDQNNLREKTTYKDFALNAAPTELITYNMLANPKYQEILEVSDAIWKESGKKHLHEVKNYIPLEGKNVKSLYKYVTDRRPAKCCKSRKTYTSDQISKDSTYFYNPPTSKFFPCC